MPRVSVIISTYNDSRYLAQALNSVRAQSFSDWEAIIINDGSTDDTDAVASELVAIEPRFRYLSYAKNRGIVPCVKEAVSLAKGEYLARLGADDLWLDPEKLAKQVEFLDLHPDYALVGTWAEVIDMSGKHLHYMKPPDEDRFIRQKLLVRNHFIDTSILYRKDLADLVGGYRSQDIISEDYSLILRLGERGKLANLPQVMAAYRLNPKGVSQTNAKLQAAMCIKFLHEHRRNYPGYVRAWLRLYTQYAIISLGGVKLLNTLKHMVYKLGKHGY